MTAGSSCTIAACTACAQHEPTQPAVLVTVDQLGGSGNASPLLTSSQLPYAQCCVCRLLQEEFLGMINEPGGGGGGGGEVDPEALAAMGMGGLGGEEGMDMGEAAGRECPAASSL